MGLSKSTYHEIVDGIIKISGLPEGVFVLCQNGRAIDKSAAKMSVVVQSSLKSRLQSSILTWWPRVVSAAEAVAACDWGSLLFRSNLSIEQVLHNMLLLSRNRVER